MTSTSLTDIKTECLVVGVPEDDSVEGTRTELDTLISDLIDSGDFKARSDHKMMVKNPQGLGAKRLVLLGVGKADSFDALAQNDAFVGLGKTLKGLPITEATLDIASLTRGDQGAQERLGYGLIWAAYEYTTTKPKPTDDDTKVLGQR